MLYLLPIVYNLLETIIQIRAIQSQHTWTFCSTNRLARRQYKEHQICTNYSLHSLSVKRITIGMNVRSLGHNRRLRVDARMNFDRMRPHFFR